MSRVAKAPVAIPSAVKIETSENSETGETQVIVSGPKGKLTVAVNKLVQIALEAGSVIISPKDKSSSKGSEGWAQAGTARALIANAVYGVEKEFERKLQLVGVGYRAQAKGDVLQLSLGYSHPVEMNVPEGLSAQTPSQTEIVISGTDRQKLCQFAAVVRAKRPPEPYKGKGIRYSDEQVRTKEAKKK